MMSLFANSPKCRENGQANLVFLRVDLLVKLNSRIDKRNQSTRSANTGFTVNEYFLFLMKVFLVIFFNEICSQLYNEVELAENGVDAEVVHNVGSTEISPPQKVDVLYISVHWLLVFILLGRDFELPGDHVGLVSSAHKLDGVVFGFYLAESHFMRREILVQFGR